MSQDRRGSDSLPISLKYLQIPLKKKKEKKGIEGGVAGYIFS